ncbi:MAG TPA: PadR family transcriptional regulator [Anaerolineales bacterium]|nr:PadR family transcriptional regulator [Anaerolineales bacterium]
MSLKHAILGFLYSEPLSGYDLKKAFDQSVRHFWPANQSQIYRTLAALKEDGLVEQEVVEREERLDMKVYHITDAGQNELHQWLSTPLPHQDFREAFLVQIYFGSKISNEEFVELLQHEIQSAEKILSAYSSMYKPYHEELKAHENPRALFLKLLPLEFGIRYNQALLDWLRGAVERVNSENYTLKDFQLSNK